MAPLLGYWNIRGYAQPIRLLLTQAGVEFDEKLYNLGPPPTFDRSEWLDVKFQQGLDFPNLPYYIDGDVKISQSIAILRHVGRQHNLDGTSNEEKTRIDVIEQQLVDYRGQGGQTFYNPQFADLQAGYRAGLPDKLKAVSSFLGERKWLAGDNLSYVDFLAYEWLDVQRIFEPGCLDAFDNLGKYVKRFEELPKVQKYMKSDSFMRWPLNNDSAKWGTRLEKSPFA